MNTVILACSGWGKTHLAKRCSDIFMDGDTLAPWPLRPSWQSKPRVGEMPQPFDLVTALERTATKGKIILISPHVDMYEYLESTTVKLLYSEISSTKLARNLKERGKTEKSCENDFDTVWQHHEFLGRWARHNRLLRLDREYLQKCDKRTLEQLCSK